MSYDGDEMGSTIVERIISYMENEEWVADENERTETEAATTVRTTDPFPEQLEEEDEEPLSPLKVKEASPPKTLPEEAATLAETVCIEDGSVLLVMLVGRKL
jgi:chromosome segregation and condensation protein ScpB